MAGTFAFDAPVASTTEFFLRRDDCGGSDNPHLSTVAGGDAGDGCGSLLDGVPNEVLTTNELLGTYDDAKTDFPAADGVPTILDAGSVTGTLRFEGDAFQAGQGTVEVQLDSDLGTIGHATVTELNDPTAGSATDYPFSFAVPADQVGKAIDSLTFSYVLRGVQTIESGGFLVLNGASHLTVPTRDAGRVEVSPYDDFAPGDTVVAKLNTAKNTWAATVALYDETGVQSIYARSVQGTKVTVTHVDVNVG